MVLPFLVTFGAPWHSLFLPFFSIILICILFTILGIFYLYLHSWWSPWQTGGTQLLFCCLQGEVFVPEQSKVEIEERENFFGRLN